MNERVKELMVQVCKEQGLPFTVEHNRAYMLDNFSEKLAQLIVRECARVIDRGNGELSTIAETAWCNGCRDDILKHFGVEE
jgi:hypothetical protein